MKTYFNFLNENSETSDTLHERIRKILRTYGTIPITKDNATEIIQRIVGSEVKYKTDLQHPTHFNRPIIGQDSDFGLMKPSNKIRMYDYLSSLIKTKTIRGDSFEGLIAGLYNGITAQKKDKNSSSKWDVELSDGKKISVKFLDSSTERPVLGNIKSVIDKMYPTLKNLPLNEVLAKIGNNQARKMLNVAFGDVTHFLFAYPEGLNIKCLLFERASLIFRYIEKSDVRYAPKQKGSYQIRINFNNLLPPRKTDLSWTLYAPKPTEEDFKYLEMSNIDKSKKLFGSDSYRIRGSILNAILKYGEFVNMRDPFDDEGTKDYFVFDYEKYKEERGH